MPTTPMPLPRPRTVAGFVLLSVLCACADDATGPTQEVTDDELAAFQPRMLTVGTYHTCALTSAGEAYCWGQNSYGQIGDGTTTNRWTPVAVEGGLTFETLVAGGTHTCGITTTGATYCWGANHRGQLGEGPVNLNPTVPDGTIRSVPGLVPGGLRFVSLSLGGAYTCGLTAERSAYCWGANTQGQFGNGREVVSGSCALQGLSSNPITRPIRTAGGRCRPPGD
jgi:alpha-tubulin suppressor-like RCC1 family protein